MRKLSAVFILAALTVFEIGGPARAADVICYNCPPQWADFASMLKAIKADLGRLTTKIPGRLFHSSSLKKATPSPISFITASTLA